MFSSCQTKEERNIKAIWQVEHITINNSEQVLMLNMLIIREDNTSSLPRIYPEEASYDGVWSIRTANKKTFIKIDTQKKSLLDGEYEVNISGRKDTVMEMVLKSKNIYIKTIKII